MTTIKISPIADTYVDKSSPDTNYGTSTFLRYRGCSYWPTQTQRIYVRFPFTGIPFNAIITSAVLRWYGLESASYTGINIRNVSDRTWTETGITWNNQPLFDTYPGTHFYKSANPGYWESYDITSYIQDQFNLGVNADFMIQCDESSPTCVDAGFASKEYSNTANRPYLEITYTIDVTTANITTTSILPSLTSCQALCGLTVDIIWTNQGGGSGTFSPGIQVGSEPVFTLPSVTLAAGASVTKRFTVTGLTAGSYIICPVPN